MKEEPVNITELNNELLSYALNRRAELKAQQDSIEAEVKLINETVKAALQTLALKTVFAPGVGSYTFSHTKRSSFNKDTMKKEMLKSGLAADKVKALFESATSYTEYDSVTFRVPEEKDAA